VTQTFSTSKGHFSYMSYSTHAVVLTPSSTAAEIEVFIGTLVQSNQMYCEFSCPVESCTWSTRLASKIKNHLRRCLPNQKIAYCSLCDEYFEPSKLSEHALTICPNPECDEDGISECFSCCACEDQESVDWNTVNRMYRYGADCALTMVTPLPTVLIDLVLECLLGETVSRKRKREEEEESGRRSD
jgi:hypothetical protein